MPKPPLLGKTPPAGGGGTQVPKGDSGIERSEAVTERLYRAAPALFRSLERRPLSNLSVSHPLDSSPGRRALGKEVLLRLIEVCRKTSRNAKASPTRRGGIEQSEDVGEVVQSSTCIIPLTRKASFVQPLSLASARQLSWQESPWQRGFVFDETDLTFAGKRHGMPKPPLLGKTPPAGGGGTQVPKGDSGIERSEAVTERLYRAAPALFRSLERRPLSNLSVSHPLDSSPGRRALGKEVLLRLICSLPENVTECQSLPY